MPKYKGSWLKGRWHCRAYCWYSLWQWRGY